MHRSVNLRSILLLLGIVLLAGFIRIQYNSNTLIDEPVRGDAVSYVVYASNLLEYGVFSKDRMQQPPRPDSYWAPGYPVFLATAIVLAERTGLSFYETVLGLQVVFACITLIFAYLLASQIVSNRWACLAALFFALSPHSISLGSYLLTETLTTMLLIIGLYFSVQGIKCSSSWVSFLGGVFFGLSYLVNPVTIVAVPAVCIVAIYLERRQESVSSPLFLKRALVLVSLPVLIVVLGWSLRNAVSVEEVGTTSSGRLLTNLIIGMHSDFHQIWRENPRDPLNPATVDEQKIAGSYSAFAQTLAGYFSESPLGMSRWYLIEKPITLWSWNILVGQGDIYVYPVFYSLYDTSSLARVTYSLMYSLHFWLLGLALMAPLLYRRDAGRSEVLVVNAVYWPTVFISAVYVMTQAEPRYSVILRPEMYVLATASLARLAHLVRSRSRQEQSPPTDHSTKKS